MADLPFAPRIISLPPPSPRQTPHQPPQLRFLNRDAQSFVSDLSSSPATAKASSKKVSFEIDHTPTRRTAAYSSRSGWSPDSQIPLSPLAKTMRRREDIGASPSSSRTSAHQRRSKTSLETPFVQIDSGSLTGAGSPHFVNRSSDMKTVNNFCSPTTPRRPVSKKRAVIIGITYAGTKDVGPMPNSADHLALLHNLLIRNLGFDKRNIWLLCDKPYSAAGAILLEPTRENILNSMKWLVVNAKPGDDLIFAFRGHGVQRRKNDSRSVVQCIIPSDYPTASLITKATISSLLIENLNIGVRLTLILDCRFSNQMLNLPYVHCVRRAKKNMFYVSDSVDVEDEDWLDHLSPKRGIMGYSRQQKEYLELKKEVEEERREALAAALFEKGDLVCLSRGAETPKKLISFSSRGEQTSLSSAFVSVMSDHFNHSHEQGMSFQKLLTDISRLVGKGNDSFLPQLSSTYKLKIGDHVFKEKV